MKTAKYIPPVMLCGHEVSIWDSCVRGPLVLMERLTGDGWAPNCRLIAHRWRNGRASGLEYEAEFKTRREALTAFNSLASHKAAISVGEWVRRAFTAAGRTIGNH